MRKGDRLKKLKAGIFAGFMIVSTVFSGVSAYDGDTFGEETTFFYYDYESETEQDEGVQTTETESETGAEPEAEPEQKAPMPETEITVTEEIREGTEKREETEITIEIEPESTIEIETELESEVPTEPEPEFKTEAAAESETEFIVESETEQESETEKTGTYQVEIVEGEEFHIILNHKNGRYNEGEIVEFKADVPGAAAVATTLAKANREKQTADLLYSEVTYHSAHDTFCFEMPADDIYLGVASDQAEAGIAAFSAESPWEEATDIEADTYYYYSDGILHPFDSVMGQGGNDSYKYVRYKASGKTYTVSAYCMQHSMQSPPSGTTYKNMIELDEGGDDKYLRKALFYGYGGPGWGNTFCGYNIKAMMEEAGCTTEMRVMQHYLVDYLYDGESGFGGALSGQARNMLKQIRSALAKMPDPAAMELLPGLSTVAAGKDTESFIWKADEAFTITIHLEDGVQLVNETTGEIISGKATVKGGDRFHLTAVTADTGSLNGTYKITSNYPLNFHAMLLKLQKSQDIGFGYYSDSSNIELTVDWPEPKGSLTVYKEGEALTGAQVTDQGVTFLYDNVRRSKAVYNVYAAERIKNAAGEVVYEKDALVRERLATGEDGSASLTDLYPGDYRVTEIKAPDKLICSGESRTIRVVGGEAGTETEIGSTTFWNERQKAAVSVVKQDESTKVPLFGGIYGLYTASAIEDVSGNVVVPKDTLIEKAVTGADGKAVYQADLPINGKYYIKEIQAPEGYLRNSEEVYTFDFCYTNDRQEYIEFTHTFENEQVYAGIALQKKDAQTGEEPQGEAILEGAVYGLYARKEIVHPDGRSGTLYQAGDLVATMRTDKEGNAELRNLYPGKYYIKEMAAPVGYVLDEQEYEIDCSYEGDQTGTVERTVVIPEQVIRQPFQIIKAANNGKTDADCLEGAGFCAYLKEKVPVKEDGSYDFSAADPVVLTEDGQAEMFTDENGYACSVALPYGTYLVRETTVPPNYAPVKDFTVVIREHRPNEPQAWRILLDDEFKAKLRIVKKDDETGRTICKAGAGFRIYDLDKNRYVEQVTTYPLHAVHKTYFTDRDGTLILPEALQPGHYRIEEVTAPDGYLLNENFTEISVDSNMAYQIEPISGDVVIEVEYEDHPVKGKLSLYKKGEMLTGYDGDFVYEEQYLKGAEFAVYADEDICAPDFQKGEDGKCNLLYAKDMLVVTVRTDENGMAEVSDLPLGSYRIEEKRAPEGFILQEIPIKIDLVYADQDTPVVIQSVTVENVRQKVKIAIEKWDAETETGLGGAVFGLYNSDDITADGQVLVKADTRLQEITSEANGLAVCTLDLPLGKYYVKEEKAPVGYVCSDEVFIFDASYQGQQTKTVEWKAVMKNEPVKERETTHKSDEDTEKPVDTEEPEKPDSGRPASNLPERDVPKTGDTANIWLPLLEMAGALGGIGLVWLKRKSGRSSR